MMMFEIWYTVPYHSTTQSSNVVQYFFFAVVVVMVMVVVMTKTCIWYGVWTIYGGYG